MSAAEVVVSLVGRLLMTAPLFALFVLGGIKHFTTPDMFMDLMIGMPFPSLHLLAVHVSGVFEIVLGVAVLLHPSPFVCHALIALVLAVTPANINMYVPT